jgi:hypothetical protein
MMDLEILFTKLRSIFSPWKRLSEQLLKENQELKDELMLQIDGRLADAQTYARVEHKLGELRLFSRTQENEIHDLKQIRKSLEAQKDNLLKMMQEYEAEWVNRNQALQEVLVASKQENVNQAAIYNEKLREFVDFFISLRDEVEGLRAKNKALEAFRSQLQAPKEILK